MKWFKQSFDFLMQNTKVALLMASSTTFTIYLTTLLGFSGIFICSFIFTFILAIAFELTKDTKIRISIFTIKKIFALLLVSIILVPTNIMLGSISALIQGSDSLFLSILLIGTLSYMSSLSYFFISFIVGNIVYKELRFGLAIEGSFKIFSGAKKTIYQSCFFATLLLIASIFPFKWATGIGFIISLPLLYFTFIFSYLDLIKTNKI